MSDEATGTRHDRQLVVERVPLSSLVADDRNPRTHDERNVDAIAASLAAHGQVEPLVAQAATMRLCAGNGRVEAMRRLGWTEADVVTVECDDAEFRALSIRLNRTGDLAGWNFALLETELAMLADAKWGDLLDFGWDDAALNALTGDTNESIRRNVSSDPDGSGTPETAPQLGQLEYRILVECPDEATQAKMLERLSELGYTCRPLIS